MSDRITITAEGGTDPGTARRVEDHQILLWDWTELNPAAKILCPESGIGGCLIEGGERRGCWVQDWFGNIGGEMVEASRLELIFDIEVAENLGDDGFQIRMTALVDAQEAPE